MYVREVDDQVLTLQVSGKLWMRSLVMRDVETGTEWAHLLGQGMAGELKGHRLKPLITDMVTWGVWKSQHPETSVLHMPRTSRNYNRAFYRQPEHIVFGFEVSGETRSITMAELMETPVINIDVAAHPLLLTFDKQGTVTHLFDRGIAGQVLTFRRADEKTMVDDQTQSTWNLLNGEAIAGPLSGSILSQRVGIMSFARAWQNFHPQSQPVRVPHQELPRGR